MFVLSERFQSVSLAKSPVGSPPRDEIPTIPDMDDLKDEILLNEIVEPPMCVHKQKV